MPVVVGWVVAVTPGEVEVAGAVVVVTALETPEVESFFFFNPLRSFFVSPFKALRSLYLESWRLWSLADCEALADGDPLEAKW